MENFETFAAFIFLLSAPILVLFVKGAFNLLGHIIEDFKETFEQYELRRNAILIKQTNKTETNFTHKV